MNERSIFAAALDIPDPAERAAYLDNACVQRPGLRKQLDELLAAQEKLGSFLARPPSVLEKTAAHEPIREGAGSTIGPYKLLQQIGEGGMGIVYMAQQQEPVRRKVALKIIKPGMDTAQVIARFEAERQALAMMDHQNIAKVFDAGTTETGRPYFVMELVHGVPLTSFCDDNRLTLRQRLELFIPVCHAIQHAHQKGIIHRDVKPSNVLVTMYDDRPVPKVIDFGIAKATDQQLTERTMFTQFGAMVGTFEYMSPEQAEMNAFGVDTRSDIYSLGVLLYELLTGTTPLEKARFRAAAFNEVVRIIKEEEPPRPSARLSKSATAASIAAARKTDPAQLPKLVRGDLDWIVMRCLEKQRDRRYETANGLARDIQRYLMDEPVEARPPSAGYRLQKFVRRNKGRAVAAALVLAVLLAGIVGTSMGLVAAQRARYAAVQQRNIAEDARAAAESEKNQKEQERQRTEDERRRADAKAAEAQREKQRAEEQLLRSERLLYANQIASAQSEWETNNVADAWRHLDSTRAEFRGWEYRYLCTLFTQNQQTFKAHGGVYCVAFSPDGKRIASGNSYGSLTLRDAATGAETMTPKGYMGRVFSLAFSPDGKRIVSGGFDGAVNVWDAATGRSLLSISPSGGDDAMCVAYSADGRRIATGATGLNYGSVTICDATNGRQLAAPKTGLANSDGVAYSRDGRRFLNGLGNTLTAWDATSGKATLKLSDGHWPAVFSPDGHRIAARGGADPDTVKVWDAATGKELLNMRVRARRVNTLAYSTDGKRIVSGNNDGTLNVFDASTGKELLALKGHTGKVMGVAFSPDGGQIASGSWEGLKTWDSTRAQGTLTFDLRQPEQDNSKLSVAFSPDGRSLVAGNVNTLKVIDAATGREFRTLDGRCPAVFSPDGKKIAGSTELGYAVAVWNARSGRKRLEYYTGPKLATSVAYSPDGKRIVGGYDDGTAIVWGTAAPERNSLPGAFLDAFFGPMSGLKLLTLNAPSGNVQSARTMRLEPTSLKLTVDSGKLITQSVAFSPDGKRIATVGRDENTIKLWDAATGKELGVLMGLKRAVTSIAFRPDGKQLVSCGFDNTLMVWDAANYRPFLTLKGHSDWAECAVFSPDGKRIASGSRDNTLKIWDAATGQELLTLNGHSGPVFSLAFSPDGTRIACASQDGTVKVWDASRGPEAAH